MEGFMYVVIRKTMPYISFNCQLVLFQTFSSDKENMNFASCIIYVLIWNSGPQEIYGMLSILCGLSSLYST